MRLEPPEQIFLRDINDYSEPMSISHPVRIELLLGPSQAWLNLRITLWPHESPESHHQEILGFLAEPSRFQSLMAIDPKGHPLGFIEGSIRSDYVNGTTSSPVGYIEGLYVVEAHRRHGIARQLIDRLTLWFVANQCCEMASDTAPSNQTSIAAHLKLGFQETERAVFFKKQIGLESD